MGSGEFAYIEIQNCLTHPLANLFDKNSDNITLIVNTDGVPLFTTSQIGFWPILAMVVKYPVFPIALYKGVGKPKNMNDFLKPFVDEAISLVLNGLRLGMKKYRVRVRLIAADAPARADILRIKHPTGYYSCSKCKIHGEWHGQTCFPYNAGDEYPLRTPETFYDGTNFEGIHFVDDLQVARIPFFNIAEDIPLDPMHKIYLGSL